MAWHTLLLCLWQRQQQQQQKNEKSFNRHSLQDTNGEERRGDTIRYTTTFHQYSFVCNFLFAKHVIYFIKRKSSFHPILNKLSSPDSWLGCCSTKSHQNYYGWKSSYEYEEEEELSKNSCLLLCAGVEMKLLLSQVITYDLIADIGIKWQNFLLPKNRFPSLLRQHTHIRYTSYIAKPRQVSKRVEMGGGIQNSMHKVVDKFHMGKLTLPLHFPNYRHKIPKLLQNFSLPLGGAAPTLNNFCWCAQNWCGDVVLLFQSQSRERERPSKIYVEKPFAILQAANVCKGRRWAGWECGKRNLNVCRETIIFFIFSRWMMKVVDPAAVCKESACIVHRKIEAGLSESEKPLSRPINDSMAIDCGKFIWETIFFLTLQTALEVQRDGGRLKLNLSLGAL